MSGAMKVLDAEVAQLAGESWTDDENEAKHRAREAALREARADFAELVAAADAHRQVHEIRRWGRGERALWQECFGLPVYASPSEIKHRANTRLRAALARAGGAQ